MKLRAGLLLSVAMAMASAGFAGVDRATDAAESEPQSVPVIRISIDLVQIDAVVTDRQGRHVTDLQPEDFTILESDEPQEVVRLAYVEAGALTSTDANAAEGSTPHMRAPRIIVFVFDDLGVSFFGAWAAQNALKKLAREPFAPGDQIGLVRTGQKESRYPFCYSNEALFKGASKLRPNMMASIREYDALFHRVHTLVGTVEGLRGLPGRKAVVFMSEGFSVSRGDYRRDRIHTVYDSLYSDDDVHAVIRQMIDVANRASVVIYAIDPRGLEVVGPSAEDSHGLFGAGYEPSFESQGTLHDLAAGTGGLAALNSNDLVGGLRRIVGDEAGYYLTGYEPPSSTFERESGKPKFHRVKVRVNRPGLQVRSRAGFYGVADEEFARSVPGQ